MDSAKVLVAVVHGPHAGKRSLWRLARATQIEGSSFISLDDAIQAGVARTSKTLKNVKGAWGHNQDVFADSKGKIAEYRVQLRVTFILDDSLPLTMPGPGAGWHIFSLIPGATKSG